MQPVLIFDAPSVKQVHEVFKAADLGSPEDLEVSQLLAWSSSDLFLGSHQLHLNFSVEREVVGHYAAPDLAFDLPAKIDSSPQSRRGRIRRYRSQHTLMAASVHRTGRSSTAMAEV